MKSLKNKIYHLLPGSIREVVRKRQSIATYNPEQWKSPEFVSSIGALDYYKCIFVHIPKNAGLSVCYTLFGNTGGSHRKLQHYQDIFPKTTFERYFKFAFVRNPWDRLVSTYFFLKEGGITKKDALWARQHLGKFNDFESFVKGWLTEENISRSLHFQHQHVFLTKKNGQPGMDFIGRLENIDEDFSTIAKRLGIERTLRKRNTSSRKKDYHSYYTQETKAIVAQIYAKDISMFNYTFES
ncbi:sulfotransferase family 2 domain-containing protein [Gangjinia marincola]|uniref:Sulfotransferase family 2 domain-containing protein n=1 Tax=Gangjinia marincola TaxID=578463 RepID=A0ABP3XPS2_9FLAO